MKSIRVKVSGRLRAGHLWIFSNEVVGPLSSYEAGELVHIHDLKGGFIGVGYINPRSLIAVRIVSRERIDIDEAFMKNRLQLALAYRTAAEVGRYDSFRIIFGESDGLPGLVVDKYASYLCVQVLTQGMEKLYPIMRKALIEQFSPRAIILRNTSSFRELEGLRLDTIIDYGAVDELPVIDEDGIRYRVDIIGGQKTGFFLDQRVNRQYLRKCASSGINARVLDCFSYSGAWALNAGSGRNVDMTCVDISDKAVSLIRENAALNKMRVQAIREDVFVFLKNMERAQEMFDLIILDPPAFIKSRAKIQEGMKGYREINLRAMKLLNSNGLLVTSSCSHHMERQVFLDLLRACAVDSRTSFRLLYTGSQSPDHPVLLAMPETDYLKTVFLKRID